MAIAEIRESEMSVMNAQTMAERLSSLMIRLVERGMSGSRFPTMMLWGPPGVGKSQGVHQAAAEVEKVTGKRVAVTDVRLMLYSPVDLHGLPVVDSEKEFAVWLKPKIFRMDEAEDVLNILFLDELTAAPQAVQAAAYQITLDRVVGEHRLPDNCVVIAAGNRVTDRSVAFKMPRALANRMCHIEIEADANSWLRWAIAHDIDPHIIGFVSYDPEQLMQFGAVDDAMAFPTPRSWELASDYIKLSDSLEEALPYITGCVGSSAATALMVWMRVCEHLPAMEDVFAGKVTEIPKKPDVLYGLVSRMLSFARRRTTTLAQIRRSVAYGSRLPADYAMLLFRGYMALKGKCSGDMRSELIKEPEFRNWLSKNGRSVDL